MYSDQVSASRKQALEILDKSHQASCSIDDINRHYQRLIFDICSLDADEICKSDDDLHELASTYPTKPLLEATEKLSKRKRGFDWKGWALHYYGRWIEAQMLEATELDRLHPMPEGTTPISRAIKRQLRKDKMKLTDIFAPHGEAADLRFDLGILISEKGTADVQHARSLGRKAIRAYRSTTSKKT